MRFSFTSELRVWPGDSPWYFVTVPFEVTDEIDEVSEPYQRGFGSVKVEVTVGNMTWSTSLFPSNEHKAFVLPIKKQVRTSQDLAVGSAVEVSLRLVDVPAE